MSDTILELLLKRISQETEIEGNIDSKISTVEFLWRIYSIY